MILTFPFRGLHKGGLPSEQPDQTSPQMQNVRPYWQGRLRGGQRPGLSKWSATQIGGEEHPVVAMTAINVVESI
jgi:hypothetical protein